MKLFNPLIKAILITGILQASAAHSETLFTSESHCQQRRIGGELMYNRCQGLAAEVPMRGASATHNSYLKNISVINKTKVRFSCRSTKPLIASFKNDSGEVTVTNESSSTQSFESYLRGSQQSRWLVDLSTEAFNTLWPDCRLEVVSNVSLPDTEQIKWYLNHLVSAYKKSLEGRSKLEQTQLPEQIAYVEAMPDEILYDIDFLAEELATAKSDLDELKAIPEEQRDATTIARIQELSGSFGTINQLKAYLDQKQSLLARIDELLASDEFASCEEVMADEHLDQSLCLTKIGNVLELIRTDIQGLRKDLLELKDFVQSEINRIESLSSSHARRLERLVHQIQLED